MENKLQEVGNTLERAFPDGRVYVSTVNVMLASGKLGEGDVYLIEAREGNTYYLAVYTPTGNDAGEGEQYRKREDRYFEGLDALVSYVGEACRGE